MPVNDLSAFLRACREAVTPEQAGLPAGPRRRTPGLRRAELAALAGISVEYLTRLEQGRDRNPSPQVLSALAQALRLNPDERAYLQYAAKEAVGDRLGCPQARPPVREARPTLLAVLDGLERSPAALVNRIGDVVAHTPAFDRLARPLGLLDGTPPNLVRFTFADPRAREAYPDWDAVADARLAAIRSVSAPTDPHLAGLLEELSGVAGAPLAERLDRIPGPAERTGTELVHHPEAGLLYLAYETLSVEELRLLVYLPGDPATVRALDRLAGLGTLRAVTA